MRYVWETGKVNTRFLWGNLRERDHLEDVGVNERIILKMDLQEVGWGEGGVRDCSDLAQDTDRWRALVNAIMNFRVP